jgi:hypothetical protein
MKMNHNLPNKFVPLQQSHGIVTHAACLDSESAYYGWLFRVHPDEKLVTVRKLENWELMQMEDRQHYGIVIEGESK